MEKTVPPWVVYEYAYLSSDNTNQKIRDSVRKYVKDRYSGADELDKDNLDALSTKPENYKVEGYEMTVGDVLRAIDDAYNTLIEINSQLMSEGIDVDDMENISVSKIKNVVDDEYIHNLRLSLDRMPDSVKSMFAQYHTSNIGGYGNQPSIGPAGDAMNLLYRDEIL